MRTIKWVPVLFFLMLSASFGAESPGKQKSDKKSHPHTSDSQATVERLAAIRQLYLKGDPTKKDLSVFEKLTKKLTLAHTVMLIKELDSSDMYRGYAESYLLPLYIHWANLDPAGVWNTLTQEMEGLKDDHQKSGWVERSAEVLRFWSRTDARRALSAYIDLVNNLLTRPDMKGLLNYPSWYPDLHEMYENAAAKLNDMPAQLQQIGDAEDFGVGIGHWAKSQLRSHPPQKVVDMMTREMERYVETHNEESIGYLRERAAYHFAHEWFAIDSKNAIAWYESIQGREAAYNFLEFHQDEDGIWPLPAAVRSFLKQQPDWIAGFLLNFNFIPERNFDLIHLIPDADQQLSVLMKVAQQDNNANQVKKLKRELSKSRLTKAQRSDVGRALIK